MFYRHHMMAKHNNSVAAIEGEPSVILIHSIPCVNGGMATTSMESRRAEGSIPAEEGAVLWLWSKDCSGCNKGANQIAEASTANKSELLAMVDRRLISFGRSSVLGFCRRCAGL